MTENNDWSPPDEPMMWSETIVGRAYHLAMLGGQRLLAGEFVEASELLNSASRLAHRAASLTPGQRNRLRD